MTSNSTRQLARGRWLAAGLALTLFTAACGDDADSSPATQPAGTVDTSTVDTSVVDPSVADTVPSDPAADGPSGPGCASVPADGEGSFAGMTDDTAATAASNNPLLSTLVTAVSEAGLVDTLNSDGPFTIFAPVNDAFAAIPPADLDAILADKEMLTSILTYHVVAGEKLSSADLAAAGMVTTVNGQDLTIEAAADGTLMINGVAAVGCADVPTANATVHIIDAVLVPAG